MGRSIADVFKRASVLSRSLRLGGRQPPAIEVVRALYKRLHDGQLRGDDLIELSAVRVDNLASSIERMHGDIRELRRMVPHYRAIYDIFRAFGPEEVVLDVGAHWGYSAVAMRRVGCRSRIISIEPMTTNAPSLDILKTLEAGGYDWINVAASSDEGTLTLYIPIVNGRADTGLTSAGGGLNDGGAINAVNATRRYPGWWGRDRFQLASVKVRASRIDTVLSEHKIGKVAAVKMDIEGHEGPALRGAVRLFAEHRPLLMVEGANRHPETLSAMNDYGYFHCERCDGHLVPHPAMSLAADGFFVHPSRVDEYRGLGIFKD